MPDYVIPNLKNACRLLTYLATVSKGLSVSELAHELEVPRTTVLRIVKTLVGENFLREENGCYSLGGGLAALGMKASGSLDVRTAARPLLEKLTEKTNETSHLALWDDGRALIAEVADCPHPLSAASKPGTRAYVHASATGKILLAYRFMDTLATVWKKPDRVRLTSKTVTRLDGLEKQLEKALKNGYAMDNEEYHEGVRCLAAPVFDSAGEVCAAMGITASCARFTRKRVPDVAKAVKNAARELSSVLGGTGV